MKQIVHEINLTKYLGAGQITKLAAAVKQIFTGGAQQKCQALMELKITFNQNDPLHLLFISNMKKKVSQKSQKSSFSYHST